MAIKIKDTANHSKTTKLKIKEAKARLANLTETIVH
jgi:hypothetical protein